MKDEWEAAEPPTGFADRVMARIAAEAEVAAAARRRRWIAGAGAGLALAAGALLLLRGRTDAGAAIARDRTEIALGARAKAVLEPGAEVRWQGDVVEQPRGDAFYRVEPGARFVVRTPAGDVEVRGTCFAVKVRTSMGDVKSGLVGAGLTALAFVTVYEGKVAISHAASRVELGAGESGAVSESGARPASSAELARASEEPASTTAAANENLVGQVREYRTRVEDVVAQKRSLEKKLASAEERLAATSDGGAPVDANRNAPYVPTEDEWRTLAKNGELRFRYPCTSPEGWATSPAELDALGLAPEDGKVLHEAFERSAKAMWSEIGPLCASALGVGPDVAARIGTDACKQIIVDRARLDDRGSAEELLTQTAEIRAGLRPAPPAEKQPPLLRLYLALTGASKAFEADLAKSLGPEEAHRLALSDQLCASNNHLGGGKKR